MPTTRKANRSIPRRRFLQLSALGAGGAATVGVARGQGADEPRERSRSRTTRPRPMAPRRTYNSSYTGDRLNRVAFPMGGLGAGMICLEGSGALSHFSLRNRPEVFHEPCVFAALGLEGKVRSARVLEGPVPGWKLFGPPGTGNGAGGSSFGLPRFDEATFSPRFPFATVSLSDEDVPVRVEITGWSPFEPGDADGSSLPVAALEYRFTNRTSDALDLVFSFNARNFMPIGGNEQAVRATPGGFVLWSGAPKERPWEEGAFSATVTEPAAKANCAWFRGGWFDPLTMAWRDI